MNTFKWLLKREYWENRGGFFWAPIVVGGITVLFSTVASVAGAMLARENMHEVNRSGTPAEMAEHAAQLGGMGDVLLASGVGIALSVMAFVIFFYALGSLYDDRRDRSILFWKSMPITDAQMVLSKAAWALVLAPLAAVAVGLLIGVALWLVALLGAAASGVPGAAGVITESHPLKVVFTVLATLPVQVIWSLPTVGWLMLCSAWARRLPFLWATAVPILACAMISFTDIFEGIEIPHDKLWYVVAYRGLLSIAPGAFMPTVAVEPAGPIDGPKDLAALVDITSAWGVFAQPDIWIGAAVGVAMIFGAVYFRRNRDEG
ncbi:ABC transporter permease [Arenimonas caeni]|jgi:ABC-2 type transport system permease protein|uniref:ABC transporter permease n=1 Tax=Arenimonas caeni TaxID=2058085 RepID=A0A2P6M7Y2_9GAMM|nr:ABC transporter permease [Arenimonas caeni]MDY0021376.1 ABC transporter permease [Arenimonas caeni]PRH82107.1 ABC transporter permease [Arenimonas caeni]